MVAGRRGDMETLAETAKNWLAALWQTLLPLLNVDLLLQFAWLLAASGFALLLSRRVGRAVSLLAKKLSAQPFMSGAVKIMERLVFPVSLLLFLVVYVAMAEYAGLSVGVLDAAISLLVAWIILRFMTGFVKSDAASRTLSLSIWIIAALKIMGVLDETTRAMDKISFTMGEARISLLIIIKSIIVLAFTMWLATLLARFVERIIKKPSNGFSHSTQELLAKISRILLFIVAALTGLSIAGFDITVFAVAAGALGVGIGFGLQKITSNFISGLILLFERSIGRDDLIQVGSVHGWVRHMGIRHTVVETFQGTEILVPNEDFITQQVTNWTYSNSRIRVDFKIGVAYGSDPRRVQEVVIEEVKRHPRCLADPAPACHLLEFGASSLNFTVLFWLGDVRDGVYAAQSDIMIAIHKRLTEEGIEIPYPVQKILVEKI